MTLSQKINKYRELLRLSQDELAKRSGVSKRTIENIEAGGYTPTYGVLSKISSTLGLQLSEIVGDNPIKCPVCAKEVGE